MHLLFLALSGASLWMWSPCPCQQPLPPLPQLSHWLCLSATWEQACLKSRVGREEHPCWFSVWPPLTLALQAGARCFPLSSSMTLFLVSPMKASPEMLQHTKQQDEHSLWAACCTHLLGFCVQFQMVLSKRLAPSCHISRPIEKKMCFLLEALALCSFVEESISPSVQKGFQSGEQCPMGSQSAFPLFYKVTSTLHSCSSVDPHTAKATLAEQNKAPCWGLSPC